MSSTVVLLEPEGLASGDITGEGIVDIDDLVRMADDWLQSGSLADIYPAPPDGDDIVNLQDFAVLAENWLAFYSGGQFGGGLALRPILSR